jgi:hypothetical protein
MPGPRTPPRLPRCGAWPLLLMALAVATGGCSQDATDPSARAVFPVAIAAQVGGGDGSANAFDAADLISIRVTVGGAIVLDETRPLPAGEQLTVSVALDRSLIGSSLSVQVVLLQGSAALFRGEGSTTLAETGTTVDVDLVPVVARVELDDPIRIFTAIGETATFTAEAVFATGDPVPGVTVSWRALDQGIISVDDNGAAVALAAGEARVEASASGIAAVTRARVEPVVTAVVVEPRTAETTIGGTVAFTATATDRNGNVLGVPVTWSSSAEAVATVSGAGVATGVAEGTSTITATAGSENGTAVLTVRTVPVAPGGLLARIVGETGAGFELTWEDRSDDETRFDIERRVGAGPWQIIGSVLAGVTRFTGAGVPGENGFRVSACNREGCSQPSNEATLLFANAPPVVQTLGSEEIGIMRGRVDAPGPFRVRFHWGWDPYDFESNSECPCYSETAWVNATASGEFTLPIPEAVAGYPMYYRIEAENAFGSATGELESLDIPLLEIGAPSTFQPGQSVPLSLSIGTAPGTAPSPIQAVQFVATPGAPITAAVEQVTDGVNQRIYTYTASLQTSQSSWYHYIDAAVTFRTGAVIGVYGPCITWVDYPCGFDSGDFSSSGGNRHPVMERSRRMPIRERR